MNTSVKLKLFKERNPEFLAEVYDKIDSQEFRQLDRICQEEYNVIALQYVITQLCDELVKFTNQNDPEK